MFFPLHKRKTSFLTSSGMTAGCRIGAIAVWRQIIFLPTWPAGYPAQIAARGNDSTPTGIRRIAPG